MNLNSGQQRMIEDIEGRRREITMFEFIHANRCKSPCLPLLTVRGATLRRKKSSNRI